MASSSARLHEELQCSICLDVFTDPVTTPCGHNFCRTCLNKCWTNTQTCFCPVCKDRFRSRPDLKINTTLREVVQHVKGLKCVQKYAVDLTLDPDSANPYLILSDDGKQVSCGDTKQNVSENPNRFEEKCILAKEGFSSGRFYYEVQVKGKTKWSLGLAKESMNRKGGVSPSPEDGLWSMLSINESQYIACDNPAVAFPLRASPEKVGVFVDYEAGLVSFYDVDSGSQIYSFTGQTFTDKLYPYFGPGNSDGGNKSIPLIILRVR